MRARTTWLTAALLLSACMEGVPPRAPVGPQAPGSEAPPASGPVAPTPVIGGVPGAPGPTPPPAPAPVEPEPEAVPELPPVEGRADVGWTPAAARGLSSVAQVDVDLTVRGVRGRGAVEVEFMPPSGLVYERRSASVEARPDESRALRFSLPVAGTTVATSGMSGTWQARFFLDGAPLTTATFTLEP